MEINYTEPSKEHAPLFNTHTPTLRLGGKKKYNDQTYCIRLPIDT